MRAFGGCQEGAAVESDEGLMMEGDRELSLKTVQFLGEQIKSTMLPLWLRRCP